MWILAIVVAVFILHWLIQGIKVQAETETLLREAEQQKTLDENPEVFGEGAKLLTKADKKMLKRMGLL